MAMPEGRRPRMGRWLILRPTGSHRGQHRTAESRTALPASQRIGSAALLGAWVGSGLTVALVVPFALSAHVPTAFAAELMGALFPRALLGGLAFATAAFFLVLKGGGPSRTLAAMSAISAWFARDILVPRTEAAWASGQVSSFTELHDFSLAIFALSVVSAALACAYLMRAERPPREKLRWPV